MEQRDSILELLLSRPELTNVNKLLPEQAIPKKGVASAYEGVLHVEEKEVAIQVILTTYFPLEKPSFYLRDPLVLDFIPHVQRNGFICYAHDEGLILDIDNPAGIVDGCLDKVIETLTSGVRGENLHHFYEEFGRYWIETANYGVCLSFVSFDSYVKYFRGAYITELKQLVFADDEDAISTGIRRFYNQELSLIPCRIGIYIPLRAPIYPPRHDSFWSVKTLRDLIFANISGSNRQRLRKFLKSKSINKNAREFIMLAVPSAQKQSTLVGLEFSEFDSLPKHHKLRAFSHPLRQVDARFKMTPYSVRRLDMAYILPRGGTTVSLADKRVLLVGCGSVGGFIGMELARAGVGQITLVDDDELKAENIFRHVLGASHLDSLKVVGLKQEIESKYPYVNVSIEPARIETLIANKSLAVESFDLAIVALGDATIEMFFNKHIHSHAGCPPAVFAWNEPLGIGGHALVTKNNDLSGCYECLHRDPDQPLYNKASFAAPGQFFGLTLTGCGSMFTPYGAMDSVQTAVLATRLAVRTLRQQEEDNPVLSWKGDASVFQQKYKTSDRYNNLSVEQLFESRYQYKQEGCRVCGYRSQ